jgi:hypothetical protein
VAARATRALSFFHTGSSGNKAMTTETLIKAIAVDKAIDAVTASSSF